VVYVHCYGGHGRTALMIMPLLTRINSCTMREAEGEQSLTRAKV
jgi:protein-tyrosine phosphatase